MTYSIYHFFKSLVDKKDYFLKIERLDEFPFDENLLSCRNKGIFPDLAIRLNKDKDIFTGGELIELKDSDSYTVSSFNSTIPSRYKEISKIITTDSSIIKQQMLSVGDDIDSLPVREVFYLVRGRKKENVKVCLVNGCFFETINIEDLISQSFLRVLEERLKSRGDSIDEDVKRKLLTILSEQESFSRVRNIDKASVKLRFRIMTEVKAEGNVLNPKKYPEIRDNTMNLIVPCHNDNDQKDILNKAEFAFDKSGLRRLNIFKIKHHFNGYFLVFQTELKEG